MSMENEQAIVIGNVFYCNKLNIRRAPNKSSDVVDVVPLGAELSITVRSLDKPWYRVTTSDGVKGFCMREYVMLSNTRM